MAEPTTKTPKAAKAPVIPADALDAALVALVAAAEAFLAGGITIHSVTSGDYEVRFQSGQLLAVKRR